MMMQIIHMGLSTFEILLKICGEFTKIMRKTHIIKESRFGEIGEPYKMPVGLMDSKHP